MKAFKPVLILILYIIFVESDGNENTDNVFPLRKEWPEQVFDSGSDESDADNKNRPALYVPIMTPGKGSGNVGQDWIHDTSHPTSSSEEQIKMKTINNKLKNYDSQDNKKKKNTHDNLMGKDELRQYLAEIKAGDKTKALGINRHIYQPEAFQIFDLGRRFVPQYPYKEVEGVKEVKKVQKVYKFHDEEDPSLIPKRAPPELVLAVAKQSELLEASRPVDPNEFLLKKESLRTGSYWNSYWKEDVEDPTNALRTAKNSKLDSMTAKLSPGTPIYDYVLKLNKLYPKLLYVINTTK